MRKSVLFSALAIGLAILPAAPSMASPLIVVQPRIAVRPAAPVYGVPEHREVVVRHDERRFGGGRDSDRRHEHRAPREPAYLDRHDGNQRNRGPGDENCRRDGNERYRRRGMTHSRH